MQNLEENLQRIVHTWHYLLCLEGKRCRSSVLEFCGKALGDNSLVYG